MTNLTILNTQISTFENLYSLNDLHKVSGNEKRHAPALFLRLEQTQELIAEIEQEKNYTDLYNLKNNSPANSQVALKTITGRHGGTFSCKELVIAYAMWISPKFHLTVLRAFLDMYAQPRLDAIASPEQKQKIKNAVSAATHLTGKPYQYVYTMLFNYLGINELAELKAHDFDRAMRYIDNWDFQSPKQSLTTPPATRLFPNAGRYLVVTDHNGNITRLQQLQDESIVNAEAYRKLRQDMYATENLLKELRCRMTMVEGQASLSRLDTPILTSVNQ